MCNFTKPHTLHLTRKLIQPQLDIIQLVEVAMNDLIKEVNEWRLDCIALHLHLLLIPSELIKKVVGLIHCILEIGKQFGHTFLMASPLCFINEVVHCRKSIPEKL